MYHQVHELFFNYGEERARNFNVYSQKKTSSYDMLQINWMDRGYYLKRSTFPLQLGAHRDLRASISIHNDLILA